MSDNTKKDLRDKQSFSVIFGALSVFIGFLIPFIGIPLSIAGIVSIFVESKERTNRRSGVKISILGLAISSFAIYILISGGAI